MSVLPKKINKTVWQAVAAMATLLFALSFGKALARKLVVPVVKMTIEFVFSFSKLKVADFIGALITTGAGWLLGGWLGALIGSTVGAKIFGLLVMKPLGLGLNWIFGNVISLFPVPAIIQAAWKSILEYFALALGSVLFAPIILSSGIEISSDFNVGLVNRAEKLSRKASGVFKNSFISFSESSSILLSFFGKKKQLNYHLEAPSLKEIRVSLADKLMHRPSL